MTKFDNESIDNESIDCSTVKDFVSTRSYIEIYDSIKCFGMNNRKGKQLKTKNKCKKCKGDNRETRSRYRIIVKSDLNKMKDIDSYCLPSVYMNTRSCPNCKAHRPNVSS